MQSEIIAHLEDQYVKNVYNKIAPYFDNTRGYTWSWIREFVNSHVKTGDVVYDIGCGNGRNMSFKKDACFIGLDNCKKFAEICERKGLTAVVGDMCDIPFDTNSADAVICIASFHHLINPQRRREALYEIARICKNNGRILLSVWSINQPEKTRRVFTKYGDTIVQWNQNGEIFDRFYYIFKIEEISKLFDECGLFIVTHKYDCGNEVFILRPK
tara:strand:+ start:9101 stop:9742 length:642 start_codon:yes stop_codon:yes gene_type:complete